jgi:hypothetical protein
MCQYIEMAERIVYEEWMWDDFPEDRDIREDQFFWDEVNEMAEQLKEEYENDK